jgi:hypothetical protein
MTSRDAGDTSSAEVAAAVERAINYMNSLANAAVVESKRDVILEGGVDETTEKTALSAPEQASITTTEITQRVTTSPRENGIILSKPVFLQLLRSHTGKKKGVFVAGGGAGDSDNTAASLL